MPSFVQMPQTPMSEGLRTGQAEWMPPLPVIEEDEPLSEVIRELSRSVSLCLFSGKHISFLCLFANLNMYTLFVVSVTDPD